MEGTSRRSLKLCSKKFTHAGQQEVSIGSFTLVSPSRCRVNLSKNSEASSIIVRSAPKSVSNTLSKPRPRNAATILPVTSVPGSSPNSSPSAALTEGAVWTMTVFSGSPKALTTSHVASFSTKAPVGQTAAHCPQYVHTESLRFISIAVAITDSNPLFIADNTPTVCTSLHIVSQRRHIIHLSISRIRDFEISSL